MCISLRRKWLLAQRRRRPQLISMPRVVRMGEKNRVKKKMRLQKCAEGRIGEHLGNSRRDERVTSRPKEREGAFDIALPRIALDRIAFAGAASYSIEVEPGDG